MAGPGNAIAAGGQDDGRLRASRADREQVIDVLKAAFTQGRLDQDELDERVSRALASRTYADLAVLTADIPIESAGARLPETARVSAGKKAVAAMTGGDRRIGRDLRGRCAHARRIAICPAGRHDFLRPVHDRADRLARAVALLDGKALCPATTGQ